ncbi:MAG: DegT/DnrJ/EryC1/StrS family aminotransferase [Verrucomicrobiales bacterium]
MKYAITNPSFNEEELMRVSKVLQSGWVTQGPECGLFEDIFAARHQVEHALATTSCTAALHLATMALELGPGDEVIVPALTWVTSAHSVEYVGAKAVFTDVDLETFNLDPRLLEKALTPRTKAIMAVHLFGLAADMEPILRFAADNNLRVIEDAACAIGTSYGEQPVGGLGTIGCFSFHPRKAITTGEGGMVTTKDELLANRVASLRNHGASPFLHDESSETRSKPWHMAPFDLLGYNLRLSDIQAAVGVAQMEKLDAILTERKRIAVRYHEMLGEVDELALPLEPEGCGHTYQSYVVRLRSGDRERRNKAMEHMAEKGIQTRPGTHAVHRLGYYREKYGLRPEEFPNACLGEDATITLPNFPGMSEEDQGFIVQAFAEGLRARG